MDELAIKAMYVGETSMDKMEQELTAVGFKSSEKLDMTLGQLSGGWKMKMGLVRAKMMDADILTMDKPTVPTPSPTTPLPLHIAPTLAPTATPTP